MQNRLISVSLSTIFLSLSFLLPANQAYADSKQEINSKVRVTLKEFKKTVPGANIFLKKAKGVLVFPEIVKAGLGIGGEYGEGALLINNKTQAYYSTASASIGFQFGVQVKSVVIIFLQTKALNKFRNSNGWKAGVDGSIALVKIGTGKSIDSATHNKPIVGFVFANKGLMYNLTLEGSKFTKIVR